MRFRAVYAVDAPQSVNSPQLRQTRQTQPDHLHAAARNGAGVRGVLKTRQPLEDTAGRGRGASARDLRPERPEPRQRSTSANTFQPGPPIAALAPPGECAFGEDWAPAPLIERRKVSDDAVLLRFGLADGRSLGLSACACLLAQGRGRRATLHAREHECSERRL